MKCCFELSHLMNISACLDHYVTLIIIQRVVIDSMRGSPNPFFWDIHTVKKGERCMTLQHKKYVSRDVVFYEHIFPWTQESQLPPLDTNFLGQPSHRPAPLPPQSTPSPYISHIRLARLESTDHSPLSPHLMPLIPFEAAQQAHFLAVLSQSRLLSPQKKSHASTLV